MSDGEALSPDRVVAKFSELTGIRFRMMPHSVQRQAVEFISHGFTLADLALVIGWTQAQIRRGEGGYSAGSLQWHVLFGAHGAADEFVVFQERLGLAEAAIKRKRFGAAESTAETRKRGVEEQSPEQIKESQAAAKQAMADLQNRFGRTPRP